MELMKLMEQHRMPLHAFQTIMTWASRNQRKSTFDFSKMTKPRSCSTVLREMASGLNMATDDFDPHIILWHPGQQMEVCVRPFQKALISLPRKPNLICKENFSFLDSRNPCSTERHPLTDELSELHHGKWWIDSWKTACDTSPESKEILVPVILYMDGITVDKAGKQTLTPLNLTLGIFNTETRRRPEAWETLYFHPPTEYGGDPETDEPNSNMSSKEKAENKIPDSMKNLHNGLALALKSLKEICDADVPIPWDHLPFAGQVWQVEMKFRIAFIIGDTKEHNHLCGHYSGGSTSLLCRHCTCPFHLSSNTFYNTQRNGKSVDKQLRLFEPSDMRWDELHNKDYFQSISHHPMDNVFHHLRFGSANPHNIHLASPGETLHMHKLGVEKRIAECFKDFIMMNGTAGKLTMAHLRVMNVAQRHAHVLTRQSDRDFPRHNSSLDVANHSKREGNEHAGVLLTFLLALTSDAGRNTLVKAAQLSTEVVNSQAKMIELVLGMNRFLSNRSVPKLAHKKLHLSIAHFINSINTNLHRSKGFGTNLIKFHLYFHLPKYIEMWGPPCGWDSSFNESHHKTEVKAPSKNVRLKRTTFIKHNVTRLVERKTLQLASAVYGINTVHQNSPETALKKIDDGMHGALFSLFLGGDDHNTPTMLWNRSNCRQRPTHPSNVVRFVCDHVLKDDPQKTITGFTEHHRKDKQSNRSCIFRAHLSHQSVAGQSNHVWHDWAKFNICDKTTPCQIMCFLNITNLINTPRSVMGYGIDSPGLFCVVRELSMTKQLMDSSISIISCGELKEGFLLLSCDCIVSDVCVVPNYKLSKIPSKPVNKIIIENQFFVVGNQSEWLETFHATNRKVASSSTDDLFQHSRRDYMCHKANTM